MNLRRLAEGSYESDDGRYSVYRDPTVAGNWNGPSWVVEANRGAPKIAPSAFPTLRAARIALGSEKGATHGR